MKRLPGDLHSSRQTHPHEWLWEPLVNDPSFVLRSMFGTKAAYLDGKLVLCFCARGDAWRGVLVCTDRERQPALKEKISGLRPHSILPKWLYLPESSDRFEAIAATLVQLALRRDFRIGVIPSPRIRRVNKDDIRGVRSGRPPAKKTR